MGGGGVLETRKFYEQHSFFVVNVLHCRVWFE